MLTRNGNELEGGSRLWSDIAFWIVFRNPRSSASPNWWLICSGRPSRSYRLSIRERVWFKSHWGTAAKEIPRNVSFCSEVILGEQVLVIPDTAVGSMDGESRGRGTISLLRRSPAPHTRSLQHRYALCARHQAPPRLDGIQKPGPERSGGDHRRRDGATQNGDGTLADAKRRQIAAIERSRVGLIRIHVLSGFPHQGRQMRYTA